MTDELYIWINRWGDFQTYQTKRGKPWAPPWLMNHTRQLDDDNYLDLTAAERGLLHDLRLEFARTRLDLRSDTTRLSRRFGYKVYTSQLERLNKAGFITICSRTVLEQFRDAFWNGSSLEVEEEVEKEQPFLPSVANDDIDLTAEQCVCGETSTRNCPVHGGGMEGATSTSEPRAILERLRGAA